jgi:hypothetical protein
MAGCAQPLSILVLVPCSRTHLLSLAKEIRAPLTYLRMAQMWDTALKERLQCLRSMSALILQCLRRHLEPIEV